MRIGRRALAACACVALIAACSLLAHGERALASNITGPLATGQVLEPALSLSAAATATATATRSSFTKVIAVSFVDALHGWSLENDGGTLTIRITEDGGLTWQRRSPVPDIDASGTILAASTRDAWIIGRFTITSTHDGGSSWQYPLLDGQPIHALDPLNGDIALVTPNAVQVLTVAGILTSPIDHDDFRLTLAATPQRGAVRFVFAGGAPGPWFIENHVAIDEAGWRVWRLDTGMWQPWPAPCGPGANVLLAGTGTATSFAACSEFTSPARYETHLIVERSDDSGATFVPISGPPGSGDALATLIVAPSRDVLLVGYLVGGLAHLMRTTDGGLHWDPVDAPGTWDVQRYLQFSAPNLGWLVLPTGELVITRDGGVTFDVAPTDPPVS